MAKKTRADASTSFWDEAVEVPRSGLPDAEKIAKSSRRMRRYAWFSMVANPIMAVALFITGVRALTPPEPVAAAVTTDPVTKAVAMAAVGDWLGGTPSPVPGAQLLTWDDFTVLPEAVPEPGQPAATGPQLQSHTLTLRAKSGTLLQVQVLVALARDGQMTAVGNPSMTPGAPLTDEALASTPVWPGMTTETASEPVVKAVDSWASAFAGGDPVALRQAIGDPDSAHSYVPLTGLTSSRVKVTTSAWVMDRSGDAPVRTSNMLVQVTLSLVWPGDPGEEDATPTATYDLLVMGADTAAPRVVAWGGPGTGPLLSAYDNAIVGRDLTTTSDLVTDEPTDESAAGE